MIAINHALTGAIIGLSSGRPVIALPAALLSHFVCDAIPHYGNDGGSDKYLRSDRFKWQLIIDAALCIGLVALLFALSPQYWFLATLCAFVASSPDFAWMPGYLRAKRGKHFKPAQRNWFMDFAARIQWFERPIGLAVEIAWFTAASIILTIYL